MTCFLVLFHFKFAYFVFIPRSFTPVVKFELMPQLEAVSSAQARFLREKLSLHAAKDLYRQACTLYAADYTAIIYRHPAN